MEGILRHVGIADRLFDLGFRNLISLTDIFCELLIPVFFRVPMEQRIVKRDPEYMLRIVGVFDDERISLYDRAHPFTRLFLVFRLDGGDGRHEDPVHMHLRETADMSVDELRREADRIGGNRGKSRFVEHMAARGGHTDGKAERTEKCRPERHVLPEGEDTRDPDHKIPGGYVFWDRVIFPQQGFPELVAVRDFVTLFHALVLKFLNSRIFRVSEDFSALTAVVGDPGLAVREADDRSFAVVRAERARGVRLLGVGKGIHRVESDESPLFRSIRHRLFCEDRGADRTHHARIRGADDGLSGVLLKCAQNGVIPEGSALDHDVIPERVEVRDPDDLCEDILDDRTAEAGHDIFRLFPVSLLGDDAAVHEDGAAAAEDRRIFRGKGGVCDLRHRDLQRGSEVFQEGTAAGGTCLVDENVRDDAVVEPDGLHVLAADIEKKRDVRHVLERGSRMGNRLDDMVFGGKCPGE